ncbi:MAG TPA: hypothetical protein VN755_09050, partial [Steroidobacteraceae bacterium]|nr:hypothetical protein [Steroidobacteraceae bacterium]
MTNPPPGNAVRRSPLADRLFGWAAQGAAWLTLALLAGILVSLVIGAWPAISKYGLGFLTSSVWDPVKGEYGGLVMIYGTIATSVIALVIAVPVSFGIALFLTELSPAWLKRPLGTAIELLAAVPSIVYGMWGLLVFGPLLATYVQQPLQSLFGNVPVLGGLFAGPPVGIGILSAGIILAIMIIPFIASVMRDVFEVTPVLLKESAYGLGSTTWDPVAEEFGGLVMIYGTIATSLIALLIAVPVSFGIALFLTELSPAWLKRPLGTAIELLAAVPSIVYGMWGLLVFGPILSTWVQQPLQKLLAGVPYLGALVSGPPV